MKKVLLVLAAGLMALSATGCVSLVYEHETNKDGVTRHELGFLGLPDWANRDAMPHGLLPIYIDTDKKEQ